MIEAAPRDRSAGDHGAGIVAGPGVLQQSPFRGWQSRVSPGPRTTRALRWSSPVPGLGQRFCRVDLDSPRRVASCHELVRHEPIHHEHAAVMTTSSIIKKLASAISEAKTEGRFHATGTIRSLESPLTIAGIGPLELPIPVGTIRKLKALATPAPYGKGTETLVDKKVRDTLEVPAESIELTETFRTALDGAVDQIAKELGRERERLSCELYKLLV